MITIFYDYPATLPERESREIGTKFASEVHGVITLDTITDDGLFWRLVIESDASFEKIETVATETMERWEHVDIGWFLESPWVTLTASGVKIRTHELEPGAKIVQELSSEGWFYDPETSS